MKKSVTIVKSIWRVIIAAWSLYLLLAVTGVLKPDLLLGLGLSILMVSFPVIASCFVDVNEN